MGAFLQLQQETHLWNAKELGCLWVEGMGVLSWWGAGSEGGEEAP